MELNEVIRRVREDKGLTQQNVADEIGVDVGTIIRWEKNGTKIKSEFLEKIAVVFEKTVAELYNYRDNPGMLNEPLEYYNSQKKISILVQLDGTTNTLNEWFVTLKKLNAALCFMLISIVAFSQGTTIEARIPAKGTTSMKEWNYITNSYANDIKGGRNIQAGYTLGKTWTYYKDKGKASFTELFRTGEESPCAYIVELFSTEFFGVGSNTFICLPINNAELYKRHFSQVGTLNSYFRQVYTEALIFHGSATLTELVTVPK